MFEFKTDTTQNINLSLTDISAGDDADLKLYRDNGNGFFNTGDQLVASSGRGSNADDSLNRRADAGTYFTEVRRYAPGSSGDVSYDLALSATTPNSKKSSKLCSVIITDIYALKQSRSSWVGVARRRHRYFL